MEEKVVYYDKIILLSDIHYGLKGGGDNTLSYLGWLDRMDSYFKEFFIPLVEEQKNKGYNPCVIICGDFFDNRVSLRIDIINRAIKLIHSITDVVDVYVLVGNHDTYRTDTNEVNSVKILQIPNGIDHFVEVIENPTVLEFAKIPLRAELIPWVQDKKVLTKLIKNSDSDVLFVHADLNGAKYPNGQKVTDGAETRGFKGVRIFSGHIHLRQELQNVTYIGSPYEIDRSDTGNVKGVYMLSAADDGGVSVEFYENTHSPRHFSYTLKQFNDMTDEQKSALKGNFVSISYTDEEKADEIEFERNMDKIGAADIRMIFIAPEITPEQRAAMNEFPKAHSDDDTIIEYIESLSNVSSEDKKFLVEKHKEYSEKYKDTEK